MWQIQAWHENLQGQLFANNNLIRCLIYLIFYIDVYLKYLFRQEFPLDSFPYLNKLLKVITFL